MALELARPVLGAAAGFESDGARREGGDEFEELGARDLWLEQDGLAGIVDAVEGEHVLGEFERDENRNPIVALVADGRWPQGSGRGSPFHSLGAMHVYPATLDDVPRISALIRSLSDPFFLLPCGEGAELFLQSISDASIQGYVTAQNFCYQVAESEGQLVGVVAVRDNSHRYHLFITPAFQGQGMARELWQLAKAQALRAGNAGRFTVNSSIGAVPVYERFGFVANGPTVYKHGISFQPMVLVENGA